MESVRQIQQRLRQLAQAMTDLGPMKRGALNEQFFERTPKGKEAPVVQGPYYVLSRKVKGKTVSERVAKGEVERVRKEMQQYERFIELSREFVDCSERLGTLLRKADDTGETLKKTLKSPSRRTRK